MNEHGYLKTIERAMDVMDYLSRVDEPARLTDISRSVRLPKSQVHRILSTLASRKLIQQDANTQRYYLGIKTWLLGQRTSLANPLLRTARPVLDNISISETIYLSILDGFKTFYLYIRYGTHPIQAVVPLGGNGPLHATATGKALLAYQPSEFIHSFVRTPLQKFTPQTITNPIDLSRELETIRAQGYSQVVDEFEIGFSGIGVPILDDQDCSIAALGISSPTLRFNEDNSANMIQTALQAAGEIQRKLGFGYPNQPNMYANEPIPQRIQEQELDYAE